MASGAEEAPEQSGSATMAATSQLQQAEQGEAPADNLCSICLQEIRNAAHVIGCFHTFCFCCIRQWSATKAACPLCRQPFNRVLHTVRADNNYQEYVIGSSNRRRRTAARERVRSRSPQRRYYLRPRPTSGEPGDAGRPAGRHQEARGDTAAGSSNASAQQGAGERLASLEDESDMMALRARLFSFMGI